MSRRALNPEQFSEREAAEKPCSSYEQDPEFGPGTCKNCLWAVGAHSAKAGGATGHGRDPEGFKR